MPPLLRNKLGFNGMVVTDASHMVGMTNQMKRKDMLPLAINSGCDMFLCAISWASTAWWSPMPPTWWA